MSAKRRPNREKWVLLLALALPLLAACQTSPGPAGQPPVDGFVGSASCRECHEEIFNGCKATFHAYKFQPATPEFIEGDFDKRNTLPPGDPPARMTRQGDRFFVTTGGPDGKQGTYAVKYVLGSLWKQRYVTEFPNGSLHVLPVQWNPGTQQWVQPPGPKGAKPGSGDFWADPERSFQKKCLGCHTTNARLGHDPAGGTYRTEWTELGVGCEACHGPGATHIAAPIANKQATVLNPARLADPRRAGMVCGACHTRGSSPDGAFAYPIGYRPAGKLNFLFDEKPGSYPDGSAKEHHQQYNDWKGSGHARAGVMCWDCHSPHAKGKSNRFQLKLPGSLLCQTCHTVQPKGVHGLHSVNNCVGCHMASVIQSATPGDMRSHTFRVIRPELTVAAGSTAKQPNSCNSCHYHEQTDPEDLVHFLKAVQKPATCKRCHDKEEPGD